MVNCNKKLQERKNRFSNLFENNKFKKIKDLIAFYKLSNSNFLKLQNQCLDYVMSSFDPKFLEKNVKKKLSKKEKFQFISKNIKMLYSITPQGLIVPKSHSYKKYKALLESYYKIFDSLGMTNKIQYWQEPIGVFVKFFDDKKEEDNKRVYHSTNNPHIESWAGFSNYGINTLLPIIGNIKQNYTEFYEPLKSFKEHEMDKPNKKNFEKIKLRNYNQKSLDVLIKKFYKLGSLFCWDNYVLHNTKIKDKKFFRLFIANQFLPFLSKKEKINQKISKNRKNFLIKHNSVIQNKLKMKFEKKNDYKFKSTLGGVRSVLYRNSFND